MSFFLEMFPVHSVSYTIMILSLVIMFGLLIGNISIFGIRLGSAGVLFSGILFGHFLTFEDKSVLEFIRELGLILFVYSIGLQIGPGFFSALRCQGVKLNCLALFIVSSGVLITYLLHRFGGIPLSVAAGLLAGATTNTPSLAAAHEALKEIPGVTAEELGMIGSGYAVSYPFGIIGIIITVLLVRFLFKIDLQKEEQKYNERSENHQEKIMRVEVELTKRELNKRAIKDLSFLKELEIIVTRVMHQGKVEVALKDTLLFLGDVIRIVGTEKNVTKAVEMIGVPSEQDLSGLTTSIQAKRLVVTKADIDGETIRTLRVRERYKVNITRICRSDIELPPNPNLKLRLSDVLIVVGEEDRIERFAQDVGNSPKKLDRPFLIPVFLGIALGVFLGNIPLYIPGIPSPIKLGLAGGPLIAAILLSYIGRIGKMVWYLPTSANFILRELGIVFFLACVGLISGQYFFKVLIEGDGFYWMVLGTFITFIPIFLAGIFAYRGMGLNFLTLCGVLTGSMTDPPALSFVQTQSRSAIPSIAYATVYPVVMLARILSIQLLILFLSK